MLMRTPRPFRWWEASRVRHAYPAELEPAPGERVSAICGESTVIGAHDRQREAPHPECRDCDRVWRRVEGIPSVYDQVNP